MLDIQLLRKDLPAVVAGLARRGAVFDEAGFRLLEDERKRLQTRTEELQARRNALSKQVGILKGKGEDASAVMAEVGGIGDEVKANETALAALQERLGSFLRMIPNIPRPEVAFGQTAEQNVEVRRWGTPRAFDFPVKDHVDLGAGLGMLDFDTAAKLSGARFSVLKGALARLHRALAQFMLDVHTAEHGYTEVYVPYMVTGECADGVSSLAKFKDDLFKLEGRDLYLIPTAEYPVTNFVRDALLEAKDLPLKFVCHSPCFRSEAGSYGKDTRGMIRQHQFDKVEILQMVHPDDVGRGARGTHAARRDDPRAPGASLPHDDAVHRRPGLRERQDLRPRGVASWPAGVPRDLVLLQLRGVPGAPHAGAVQERRQGACGTGAHAQRLRPRGGSNARGDSGERPAGGRLDHRSRRARALRGRRRADLAHLSTRFVVVRHGETQWNLASRIQGHGDSPLTPAGEAQAAAIARRLSGERFDHLVSSDLGRAWRTAQAIAAPAGREIVADPRLRERNYGVLEGLTYGEIDLRFPDVFSRVRGTDPDFTVPGGESRRQLFERIRDAFESLALAHEGRRLVVVCHGGVLAVLYRHVHGIDVGAAHAIPIPNASYNALVHERGRWRVEAWADTAHLEAAEPFVEP